MSDYPLSPKYSKREIDRADDRIDCLPDTLRPANVPTHHVPPKVKRIAVKLSWRYGIKVAGWIVGRSPQTVSGWRAEATGGLDDENLNRRHKGGTPRKHFNSSKSAHAL